MSIKAFLYRRLSNLITCELKLLGNTKISLASKYEVASFQDVFCHPFYWQIFHLIDSPPNLIVDCGAHCGHFSILADICIRNKFPSTKPKYILIEPNPHLLLVIDRNLVNAGLGNRYDLISGVLGANENQESLKLYINPKNFLNASLTQEAGLKSYSVKPINLSDITRDLYIDLIKVDIEGAEYDFLINESHILEKIGLIVLELHQLSANDYKKTKLLDKFKEAKFHILYSSFEESGNQLMILKKILNKQ